MTPRPPPRRESNGEGARRQWEAKARRNNPPLRSLYAWAVVAFVLTLILLDPGKTTCAASSSALLDAIRDARGDSIPTSGFLTAIAQTRAGQITVDYSHEDDGARDPLEGLRWGEVLAYNSYPEDLTERVAVDQWVDSTGHRGVLLGDWTHVGVGVADAGPSHYYAAIFATLKTPQVPGTDTCG